MTVKAKIGVLTEHDTHKQQVGAFSAIKKLIGPIC